MLLDSQIYSVTVFSDRALVERTAKVNLAPGEQSLVFGGLPLGLDTNSIQVGGGQKCILLEIKAKDVQLNEIPDDQKKALHHEIEQLEFQIEDLSNKVEIFRQEKELLQKLTELSSETPKKGLFPILIPDKVNEILSFYSGKMTQIDQELRLNNRELVKLNEQLNKLKQQANLYNNTGLKTEKQVEIKLFTEENTEHILVLSYVVKNASWKPIYDLRLNSEEKKFVVGYNAIITQRTGEKWENVKLKLSTAKPQISASQPKLSTWFINVFYPSPPSPKMKKEISYRSSAPVMKAMSVSDLSDKFMEAEEAPMPVIEAQIETGASAVSFAITGTHSVNDNNEKHKVGISNLSFDAILDYYAAPKFSPYAYLTATSTNNSEFPMLAGDANVFLDNNFVANSYLKMVAPNQEFKISLGIDEGVQIEYKLVNKFSKDEGLFSKKNKIVFEYKTEIKNNKKIDCLIKVKDQIPVSQNQDIKVELLDPKYKEDSPNLKKTDDGIIEWNQKINPGEKIQLGLKFSVEYPREIEITGLE